MSTPKRDLTTKENVIYLCEQAGIYKELESDDKFKAKLIELVNKEFPEMKGSQYKDFSYVGKLAEIIARTEQKLAEIGDKNNTLTNKALRVSKYRSDTDRKEYCDLVFRSCLSKRIPDDDDTITIESGGMVPNSGIKREKHLVFIVGSAASGKSRYATALATKLGAYLIDSDYIKRKLPEFNHKEYIGASLVHKESKDIQERIMNYAISSEANIVSPIIGKDYDTLRDLIETYESEKIKYKVSFILIAIDRLTATLRGIKRFVSSKRYVGLSYILDECGHEPIAAFYRIAAEDRKRTMIAIDNTDKENRFLGVMNFRQNGYNLSKIIKNKIIDGRIEKLRK